MSRHSPEQFLRLLEDTLAQRAFLPIAQTGEFLELCFLLGRQMGRHLDIDAHVQIAMAVALNVLHALALEPKHRARLSPRWNFDGSLTFQSRHWYFIAKRTLHK